MALEDYRGDMEMCCRCSLCKFMPVERIKGYHHVNGCPSIARYNFHAYSGGGRLNIAVAMLQERLDFSDKLLEVVYNCQMCGACDVSCKYVMDMEVLEPLNELRIKCVEDGRTIPALDHLMKRLRKQGAMVPGSRAGRGKWAHGLDVKAWAAQKTEVLYHAGCRSSFDKELWSVARATVTLLQKAGVASGASLNIKDLVSDPQLKARRFFIEAEHPVLGTLTLPGLPWRPEGKQQGNYSYPPLLGEHNDYVFGELLGLSSEEIQKLKEEKVIY